MNITRQMIAAAHDVTMRHKIVLAHDLLSEIYQSMKSASPPQRKPLTDEQIDAVMPQPTEFGIVQPPWNGLDITILRAMARAIEAAHGIKE